MSSLRSDEGAPLARICKRDPLAHPLGELSAKTTEREGCADGVDWKCGSGGGFAVGYLSPTATRSPLVRGSLIGIVVRAEDLRNGVENGRLV